MKKLKLSCKAPAQMFRDIQRAKVLRDVRTGGHGACIERIDGLHWVTAWDAKGLAYATSTPYLSSNMPENAVIALWHLPVQWPQKGHTYMLMQFDGSGGHMTVAKGKMPSEGAYDANNYDQCPARLCRPEDSVITQLGMMLDPGDSADTVRLRKRTLDQMLKKMGRKHIRRHGGTLTIYPLAYEALHNLNVIGRVRDLRVEAQWPGIEIRPTANYAYQFDIQALDLIHQLMPSAGLTCRLSQSMCRCYGHRRSGNDDMIALPVKRVPLP